VVTLTVLALFFALLGLCVWLGWKRRFDEPFKFARFYVSFTAAELAPGAEHAFTRVADKDLVLSNLDVHTFNATGGASNQLDVTVLVGDTLLCRWPFRQAPGTGSWRTSLGLTSILVRKGTMITVICRNLDISALHVAPMFTAYEVLP
jgi:hypothetical protein